MTRNRFNQTKNRGASSNTLTLIKARGLFLEDNPPIDEKDVNKEYCDNNLLSSSNKMEILSKNITELRK